MKNISRELCLIFIGIALWPEMELLVPSLPELRYYFGVSEGQIQQLLSVNFLGFITSVFFAGALCDSLGRKKVGILGLLLFLLASLGCIFSPSFGWLILARFIQGLAVSAPTIASITMLMEITSGHRQVFWLSMASASISFSMSVAPIIGSYINEMFGFRANLWAIFILAFTALIPFVYLVPETLDKHKRSVLSLSGIFRSNLSIITNRSFMKLALVVSAMPAAFWVYSGVSSLYMVEYLALDARDFGLYQGLIVASFSVMSVSMSFCHKYFGLHKCLRMGSALMIIGLIGLFTMSYFQIEDVINTTVYMMLFVAGMTPINSMIYPIAINLLPRELQGSGQSMIQALRLSLASVGTMSLGFLYQGPFMPVACILIILFLLSTSLLAVSKNKICGDI